MLFWSSDKIPYVVCLIEDPNNKSYFQWTGSDFVNLGSTGGGVLLWEPQALNLMSSARASISLFGAPNGMLLTFPGNANGIARYNHSLIGTNGLPYDGSNIQLELIWQIFTAAGVGDDVLWQLDYKFLQNGDDNFGPIVNTITIDFDVSLRTARQQYTDLFAAISGPVGATHIQFNLSRIASGPGADTYPGDSDLYNIRLKKA